MSWRASLAIWVGLVLSVGGASWGLADSPSGEPPFGLDFADGTSGQQYDGVVGLVFRGFDGQFAPLFEAVTRLRKGNEVHVFYTEYACDVVSDSVDPCDICDDAQGPVFGDGPFLIDVGQATKIQLCLQDSIEAEVIADFQLGSVDVRLKNVSTFVSEPDPANPSILVVGADIEVTTK